jgi:hypothetical protein
MQQIPLTMEQKMTYSLMFRDLSEMHSVPVIPTPPWVLELGLQLKDLFQKKVFTQMYLDEDGMVVVK